ncbi:MAG: hypothetical protein WAM42_08405 [Candidatus Nitrosopolaris sp.]
MGLLNVSVLSAFKYSAYLLQDDVVGIRLGNFDGRSKLGHNTRPYTCFRRSSPFFSKPSLKIVGIGTNELTDSRWSRNWEALTRFVEVMVKNTGDDPAIDCQVKLNLLHSLDGCKALSAESKFLTWENGDTKTTISAKYGEAKFYLAFSCHNMPSFHINQIRTIYCGVKKQEIKPHSWIGTLKALENPHKRDQDGMCDGKFKIHVEIYTVTGDRVYTDFIIDVGGAWQK